MTVLLSLRLLVLLSMASGMLAAATRPDSTNSTTATAVLSNGRTVPLVGLGCASGVRQSHIITALQAGYRYLDTAQSRAWGYHEEEVAAALLDHNNVVARSDVFVTTKIHPQDLGPTATQVAIERSLALPGFGGYLDAVLIHKPRCWPGACTQEPEGTWQDAWKVLEDYYRRGLVKAIGICDVSTPEFLLELLQQEIPPHIIQNWFDPFHQEPRMRPLIQEAGILFQAYSTLGTQWKYQGRDENPVLTSPILWELANQYGTDGPAPIVIQWATRHNISVLPASTNPPRQHTNLDAGSVRDTASFWLTDDDLQRITELDGTAPPPSQSNPHEVALTLVNPHTTRPVEVSWVGTDESLTRIGSIGPQESTTLTTYEGHVFVLQFSQTTEENATIKYTVDRSRGRKQTVLVDESLLDDTSDDEEGEEL